MAVKVVKVTALFVLVKTNISRTKQEEVQLKNS